MLTGIDYIILDTLKESRAWRTGKVSNKVTLYTGHKTARERTAFFRGQLLRLKGMGLVEYLDTGPVIQWIRTSAGTQELEKAYRNGWPDRE